jgi:nitrogen-specific signal transduction histidine kinase/CheY-like chemotaxis protein
MPVAGVVTGVVVVLRDVTERLVAEERLNQAEKLESIGKLAGGIAHDFNNMLAVMCAAAGLAERAESDSARRGHLRTIIASAEQVAESNRRLLAFARKDPVRREVDDLREVVGQAHELLRHSLERAIAIRCDCGPLALPVLGDRSALLNAVINLGINARDAMPGGGTLAITTALVELGPGTGAAGGGELPPGRYAELTVTDSGHGIPDDVLPRIFDPFFTTKPVGKGTGLGLSAVYGTVRAHGGAIGADNLPGGGARFRLLLPLTTRPPSRPVPPLSAVGPAIAAPPDPTTPPVVLLVDDDAEVRQLTADILADLGCTVLTARNGREALTVLAAEGTRIRLAVLDVIMPEMGGVEAFREMRHLHPGLRVLFSSGYAGGDDVVALVEPGRVAAIEKPFTMVQLGAAVKGLLGP